MAIWMEIEQKLLAEKLNLVYMFLIDIVDKCIWTAEYLLRSDIVVSIIVSFPGKNLHKNLTDRGEFANKS